MHIICCVFVSGIWHFGVEYIALITSFLYLNCSGPFWSQRVYHTPYYVIFFSYVKFSFFALLIPCAGKFNSVFNCIMNLFKCRSSGVSLSPRRGIG